MAVRTTLPDTTIATAAIIFLISLQFAASRSPSSLQGSAVREPVPESVPLSEPETENTATRIRTRIRLPSENIRDEPESVSVSVSEPERERDNAATVMRAVPLTRLRFNDLRSIDDRRYFVERFGFPGRSRDCRHHHGSDRALPTPVITEIIRYVDEPAIPMEIIRYVDETAAPVQQKEEGKVEPAAKTSRRVEADFAKYMVDEETAAGKAAQSAKEEMKAEPAAKTSRSFPKPVEAQPVEPEFARYVDDAVAKAAQYKEVKPAANVKIVKYVDAVEATAAMMAAAKKEVKTEQVAASVTGSPVNRAGSETVRYRNDGETEAAASVHRSRYNLHRGSNRAGLETIRYRDAAAATEAKPKKDDVENKEVEVNKDDGFSKYMMKYNSRNFQKFGHQKFVRHLPHKREEEKKGELTRIVKRIRKFLDF